MTSSVFASLKWKAYPYHFAGTVHVDILLGGVPSDEKVVENWLKAKLVPDNDEALRKVVAETMLERNVTADEAVKIVADLKTLNGFKSDDKGLYYEGRQLKAALKEAVSVAVAAGKLDLRGWGTTRKFLTSYFPEHVFVAEERLYVGREQPDGVHRQFVHSRYGSSIAHSEYVQDVDIAFTVVTDHNFKPDEWAMIWLTGEQNGLGAGRSMGFGTYEVTRWEQIEVPRAGRKKT